MLKFWVQSLELVAGVPLQCLKEGIVILFQNGKSAEENRFPYVVSLKTFFTQRHLCGGVLVAPNVVITAAHCVDPANPQAEIRPRVNIGGLKRHDSKAEVIYNLFSPELCVLTRRICMHRSPDGHVVRHVSSYVATDPWSFHEQ